MKVRNDSDGNFYVDGLSTHRVENTEEAMKLLTQAIKDRVSAKTAMNEVSSRSHMVATITVNKVVDGCLQSAKLNLVDLAGSEKIK